MPECLNDNHMFYTRPTIYTDQPSTQANPLHRPTLYTDQHSTQANTLHRPTLYTGQHSTHANTLHRPTLYTEYFENKTENYEKKQLLFYLKLFVNKMSQHVFEQKCSHTVVF